MTPEQIDALADKISDEHGTFGAWAEAEAAAKAGIVAGLACQEKRVAELEAQFAPVAAQEETGWSGYVTVAAGEMLKPSRYIPDGTYALIDREVWDAAQSAQLAAPVAAQEPVQTPEQIAYMVATAPAQSERQLVHNCARQMREAGLAAPRTCPRCKLGPCTAPSPEASK